MKGFEFLIEWTADNNIKLKISKDEFGVNISLINVGDVDLKDLPKDFFTLSNINYIFIKYKRGLELNDKVYTLPIGLANIGLNTLSVHFIHSYSVPLIIPKEFYWQNNLRSLKLNGFNVLEIHPEIRCLKNLSHLNISGSFNQNMYLPPEIGELQELTNLSIFWIDTLPPEIGKLKKLKSLDISGIKYLPQEIGELQELTKLSISNAPNLKSLPEEMRFNTKLAHLYIASTGIRTLPNKIHYLSNLRRLDLVDNHQLVELPEEITRFKPNNSEFWLDMSCSDNLNMSDEQLEWLRTLDKNNNFGIPEHIEEKIKQQKLKEDHLANEKGRISFIHKFQGMKDTISKFAPETLNKYIWGDTQCFIIKGNSFFLLYIYYNEVTDLYYLSLSTPSNETILKTVNFDVNQIEIDKEYFELEEHYSKSKDFWSDYALTLELAPPELKLDEELNKLNLRIQLGISDSIIDSHFSNHTILSLRNKLIQGDFEYTDKINLCITNKTTFIESISPCCTAKDFSVFWSYIEDIIYSRQEEWEEYSVPDN